MATPCSYGYPQKLSKNRYAAVVDPVIRPAATYATGKALIDHADKNVKGWIDEAKLSGNVLLETFFNEMKYMIDDINSKFGKEISGKISEASADAQLALNRLNQVINDTERRIVVDMSHIQRQTVVDLRRMLLRVPFFGEDFYIGEIKGLYVEQSAITPRLHITGVGFGFPSGKFQSVSTLELKVNNRLTNIVGTATDASTTSYDIPAEWVKPIFKSNSIERLKCQLIVNTITKKFFVFSSERQITVPIILTFLPDSLGEVRTTVTQAEFDWRPSPVNRRKTQRAPDANGKPPQSTTITIDVEQHNPLQQGDLRIRDFDWTFTNYKDGADRFIENPKDIPGRVKWGQNSLSVTLVNRSHPGDFVVVPLVDEWTFISNSTNVISTNKITKALPIDINVPKTAVKVRFGFKSILGEQSYWDFTKDRVDSPVFKPGMEPNDSIVSLMSVSPIATGFQFSFKAKSLAEFSP